MREGAPPSPATEGPAAPPSRDLLASVVVFLVALPLCMGVAIASGVPPILGLITGIVGGIVVGALAGCPLQVSGPAAGLAVIVWEIVHTHGLETLGVVVLGAGVVQVLAGALKLGRWFRAVSPAVIQGMLAGIGVLILGSQVHVMLDAAPRSNGLENLLAIPGAVLSTVSSGEGAGHPQAALVGVATIAALVTWNLFAPKKLRMIPGALVGVLVAVAIASLFALDVARVEVPAGFLASLEVRSTASNLGLLGSAPVLVSVFTLALVASAETMLCATATDRLHHGPRTDYDRELIAQGAGNLVCGALGALPVCGVIVRSTENIESGATGRRSAVLHGLWLLVFVAALPFVLALIPVAALAAILVAIGCKLANPAAVRKLYRAQGAGEVAVYLATVGTIVATNLLTGILVGFGLAALKLLWGATRLRVDVEETSPERVDVHLYGAATFVGLPQLAQALEGIPLKTHVEIHLDHLAYADAACLDFLVGYERRHSELGGNVHVCWETLRQRRNVASARLPRAEAPAAAPAPEAAEPSEMLPVAG
ncbi:MAG: SulP family inorganic anion transporter [Planctomycetota bacterium]|nr:MAG: SulP family inorganic anion transporter [Planctomycetota bacterium]